MGASMKDGFQIRNCGNPGTPKHGSKIGTSYQVGSTLRYECNKDFERDGPETITCTEMGVWSGSVPHCRVIYKESNDEKFCEDGICKRMFTRGEEFNKNL
jgi:hypothetical protein